MPLLHSTSLYITLQWLHCTVLESPFHHGSTSTLLHATLFSHWVYLCPLHFSYQGYSPFYSILLYHYHGSTSLYSILHHSLLGSTLCYHEDYISTFWLLAFKKQFISYWHSRNSLLDKGLKDSWLPLGEKEVNVPSIIKPDSWCLTILKVRENL